MELKLKYSIVDVECLEDYFSLQAKSESSEVKVYECYNDKDCYNLYEALKQASRPMYYFGIGYDPTMLNALCKLVEKKQTNILYHLRKISDYIIYQKVDYFRLNAEFWVDGYFKIKESNSYMEHDECFEMTKTKIKSIYSNDSGIHGFINDYSNILGKSQVFKNLIINSIPKIYYYYNIDVNKTIKPSISLKKLQLIHEGYNIKFDFAKYTRIEDIKKDGLFEKWIEYSKNDVLFLEKLFLGKPKEDIIKRYYAYKAVKKINPDFEITNSELYSENNTALITKMFQIPKPIKDFEFDYDDHIKTEYPDFNHFVSFINRQNYVQKDKDLKKMYCENYDKIYIDDDITILNDNKVDVMTGSFDELDINGTKVKFGLGGLHGAIDQYIGENLLHLDYKSQYPSIILQYKEFFKNIINVTLYEAVYNLKNKPEDLKIELSQSISDPEELKEEFDKIISGVKLILNSLYGLINSNFKIPIACKKLGRFICLKGQSLLINLSYKLINRSNEIKIINANTDGLILKVPADVLINDIIELDRDGYFILDVKEYKSIVQKDVNSYILDSKVKGAFNIRIKQNINRHERLSPNTINAIRMIQGKDIKILPIYFDTKWIDKDEKAYYFATKEHGQQAIKLTKKPEIICINDQIMYFTDDIEKADLGIYKLYADMTKEKILNFTWVNSENTNKPFIEIALIDDIAENIKNKKKIKRELYKLVGGSASAGSKYIGFVGYKGNIKANSYFPSKPITPLVHYTMTQIQNSTYCQGFSIHNLDDSFIIIDVDALDKTTGKGKVGCDVLVRLIIDLKECYTLEVWNNQTDKYNRKYIFLNTTGKKYKINDKYNKFIEILDKAVIWSMDSSERTYNYEGEIKPIPNNIIEELLTYEP